jgi:hypothetical protein
MVEKEYAKPVWSYADSMARPFTTGIPGNSMDLSLLQGTSDKWRGQHDQPLTVGRGLEGVGRVAGGGFALDSPPVLAWRSDRGRLSAQDSQPVS